MAVKKALQTPFNKSYKSRRKSEFNSNVSLIYSKDLFFTEYYSSILNAVNVDNYGLQLIKPQIWLLRRLYYTYHTDKYL